MVQLMQARQTSVLFGVAELERAFAGVLWRHIAEACTFHYVRTKAISALDLVQDNRRTGRATWHNRSIHREMPCFRRGFCEWQKEATPSLACGI